MSCFRPTENKEGKQEKLNLTPELAPSGGPAARDMGGEECGGAVGGRDGQLRGHPQPRDRGHLQLHRRKRGPARLRGHAHDGSLAGVI